MNRSNYKKVFPHWIYEDCLTKRKAKVYARKIVRRYLKRDMQNITIPSNHNGGYHEHE